MFTPTNTSFSRSLASGFSKTGMSSANGFGQVTSSDRYRKSRQDRNDLADYYQNQINDLEWQQRPVRSQFVIENPQDQGVNIDMPHYATPGEIAPSYKENYSMPGIIQEPKGKVHWANEEIPEKSTKYLSDWKAVASEFTLMDVARILSLITMVYGVAKQDDRITKVGTGATVLTVGSTLALKIYNIFKTTE